LAVDIAGGVLRVRVSDNGSGGANPADGSGLVGLKELMARGGALTGR
jgi:hypothetical protein